MMTMTMRMRKVRMEKVTVLVGVVVALTAGECTTRAYAQGASCELTGGEVVADGWGGNDTGTNFCNTCGCNDGLLACTRMFCEPELSLCVCPLVYDPVCGSDKATYSNDCEAACENVDSFTLGTCEDACGLAPETGIGRAAMQRFFYNATSAMCEPFTFGGVGGNVNNYETIEECETFCVPDEEEEEFCPCPFIFAPVCGDDGVTTYGNECEATCAGVETYTDGPCPEGCETETGEVLPDGYSGPGVGDNYCNTCNCNDGLLACTMMFCEPVCELPPETGFGRAAFERFFYNTTSAMCEPFIFGGGVGGNMNNFETIEECEDFCLAAPEPEPEV